MQRWLFLFLFSILFTGCREQKESNSWSLVHADTLNSKFIRAEELMRLGNFPEAADEYQKLRLKKLPMKEAEYARLSEALAYLLSNDSVSIKQEIIKPINPKLNGLYHLAVGVNSFHKNNSGLYHLDLAMEDFKRQDCVHTLPYLLALDQLGTFHRTVNSMVDSSIFYFQKAAQLSGTEKKFSALQPTYLYQLVELSIMKRDIYVGLMYAQQALSISLTDEMRGKLLTRKGILFRKLNQYDSAQKYYRQAAGLLDKKGREQSFSILLREQALDAILRKDENRFHKVMGELKKIDSVKRGPVNLDRLYGYFYFTFNEPEKSVRHYESAVGVLRKQRPFDIIQIGEAYYLLTEQYRVLKKFDKAELNSYQSMIFNSALKNAPYQWENIFSSELSKNTNHFIDQMLMADLYLDHYEYESNPAYLKKALYLYQSADSTVERRLRVDEEDAKLQYRKYSRRICSGAIRTCYLGYNLSGDTSILNLAHQFFDKSKDQMMYQDMLAREKEYFPGVDEEFKSREFRLKKEITRLKRNADGLSTHAMTRAISDLEIYYREMKEKYPSYYESKFRTSVKPIHYFQKLSEQRKSTFVQYHISNKYIYFLTYETSPQFGRIPFDTSDEKRLRRFNELIRHAPAQSRAEGKRLKRESNFVYKKIIRPIRLSKPNLLVVAEGSLCQLPFEALLKDTVSNFTHSLLEDYVISYAHSLKSYDLSSAIGVIPSKSILAYSYSSSDHQSRENQMPELHGSFKELEIIRNVFSESELRLKSGNEATSRQFLMDMDKKYYIAHIAMHASASVSDRLDNKIFFKGKDGPDAVYGYDIATKKFQADLVVLTGCETSIGAWAEGEGTFSLERAFKQAGAKYVIASLWKLPDQNSADIIKFFYEHLKQGKPIDRSLTEAKLRYLSTADEFTSHPYFWAPLISF